MGLKSCWKCEGDELEFIKDYEWTNELDSIELIDVYKCVNCDCIHWSNETHDFYEFACKKKVETNAAGGYITDQMVALKQV